MQANRITENDNESTQPVRPETGQRLVRELNTAFNPWRWFATVHFGLPEGVEQQADLAQLDDDVTDGCDVVVFAAGSGRNTSDEMTDKVDRDGAKRLIDLSVASNAAVRHAQQYRRG